MNRIASLLLLALAACGASGSTATSTTPTRDDASDPYAGQPTIYDLVGPLGQSLSRERLLSIASYIRRLEQDREGVMAHDARAERSPSPPAVFLAWLTESPDVSVVMSTYLAELARDHGADVGPLAAFGSLYGMTAHLIEHPGADPRGDEVQLAGVEFVLSWYEQGIRAGAERNAFFDFLVEARDGGRLAAWYAENVRLGP
jgi:hypothetical protein